MVVQLKPTSVAKAKPSHPSFADLLKQTQKEPTAKEKKTSVPILDTPPEMKEYVDRLIKGKKAKKVAEAEIAAAEGPLKAWVKETQDKDGFSGKYRTSYKIQGTEDTVTYVTQDSYSIESSDQAQIEEILGDSFGELIEAISTVTLKAEVLQNPELQARLIELVGDEFVTFFETITKLTTKSEFNKRIYQFVKPDQLMLLETFVRPKAASIRA